MSIAITDDSSDFDALRSRLAAFNGRAGLAGLFDQDEATKGGRHEFGDGVPQRTWLSSSTDAEAPRLVSTAASEIGDVVDGDQAADDALEVMAKQLADAAVAYVEGGRVGGPALSEQAKRTDPRKLIDEGDMIGSVEARVVNDGELEG
jgi:hypothetical protein